MSEQKIQAMETSPSFAEKAMKHKWMLIGGGILLVLFVLIMVTQPDNDPNKYQKKEKPKPVINMLPGDARESDWVASAQVDLRETLKRMDDMQKDNKDLKDQIRVTLDDNKRMRETSEKALQELETYRRAMERDGLPTVKGEPSGEPTPKVDVPVLPPNIIPPPRPGDLTEADIVPMPNMPGTGRTNVGADGQPMAAPEAAPLRRPVQIKGNDMKTSATSKKFDAAGREVTEQIKKNPFRGYLPAGSFADVALLAGVEAGTAEFSRANPTPFLLRVQGNMTTAGGGKYKTHSCFVTGDGFGELSSERVFVRATKLICMDKDQKLILEEAIKGYMVDSDGTMGLRGVVIRRNGQLIAKALLAGVAEGIAEVGRAASQANAEQITSPLTGGGLQQTSVKIDAGKLGEAGAFQGASNAAGILADMYITEAKSMFPVIQVPAGRKGTLVIQEGKSLEWKTYEGLFIVEQVPAQTRGNAR